MHPLDRVLCRPQRFHQLAEREGLYIWPQTFVTTRERAGQIRCEILETVEPYRAPASDKASSVPVERRKLRGLNRRQPAGFNRAG